MNNEDTMKKENTVSKEDIIRAVKFFGLVLLLVNSFILGGIYSIHQLADNENFIILTKPAVVLQYSDTDMKEMSADLEQSVKENAADFLQTEDMKKYMEAKQAYEENPSTETMTELYNVISQTYTKFFKFQVENSLYKFPPN
mgnify:FL=1